MADTNRSVAELLLLLADNTTGDISPQDMRDVVVSLTPAHAALSITTPAETIIATVDTPVKAAGTTAASGGLHDFTMPANNRLQFEGVSPRECHIAASLSITAASNNVIMSIYFAKNGATIGASQTTQKIGTGSDIQAISTTGHILLSENDYIEVCVENNTDASNVTVEKMEMSIIGLIV